MYRSQLLQQTRALARPAASARSASLRQKHTLPDLPYDYNALEPVISAEIMQLHHAKHHQAYVNNLNDAEGRLSTASSKSDLAATLAPLQAVKFNGGGHLNHSIFWKNLVSPKDYTDPSGEMASAIQQSFGSLSTLQTRMSAAAVGVQGSGWAWLGYEPNTKTLQIATTANQDPLHASTGLVPLLGIDVWEHAYYLQYKNVRPDYLKAIWKIVNWKDVAANLAAAASKK